MAFSSILLSAFAIILSLCSDTLLPLHSRTLHNVVIHNIARVLYQNTPNEVNVESIGIL